MLVSGLETPHCVVDTELLTASTDSRIGTGSSLKVLDSICTGGKRECVVVCADCKMTADVGPVSVEDLVETFPVEPWSFVGSNMGSLVEQDTTRMPVHGAALDNCSNEASNRIKQSQGLGMALTTQSPTQSGVLIAVKVRTDGESAVMSSRSKLHVVRRIFVRWCPIEQCDE
jgi:hypothetical protein